MAVNVAHMPAAAFDDFTTPLDYPMYVLTVPGSGRTDRSGCLIGFSTQCSISPPRFLACVSKSNHTYRSTRPVTIAAVHLLTVADRDLAALFGTETGDVVDKFAHCAWTEGPLGVPLLDRCPTRFVGDVLARIDLGDHEGLLLHPTLVGRPAAAPPLMFSAVADFEAGHPA
jgi:flavin reductase (DIM6/NTAB) family NADH-FMN oxidoreductase RutF